VPLLGLLMGEMSKNFNFKIQVKYSLAYGGGDIIKAFPGGVVVF